MVCCVHSCYGLRPPTQCMSTPGCPLPLAVSVSVNWTTPLGHGCLAALVFGKECVLSDMGSVVLPTYNCFELWALEG